MKLLLIVSFCLLQGCAVAASNRIADKSDECQAKGMKLKERMSYNPFVLVTAECVSAK